MPFPFTLIMAYLIALAVLAIGFVKKSKALKIASLVLFLIGIIATFILASGTKNMSPVTLKNEQTNQPASTEKTIVAKTDFYEITAKYPIDPLDQDKIMEQFVKGQVESKKEEWKIGGQIYNEEKDAEKQFPDRPKMVYTLVIDYEKFQSDKMETVSYLFKIGSYTGGANGDERVQTFTFDKNGKVDLESILNLAGYTKNAEEKDIPNDIVLSNLLLQKTKADSEKFPNTDLVREGLGLSYLKSDGITLDHKKCNCDGWFYGSNLQNFILADEDMVFYFGKCDITICASGSVGIMLDWESLEPYLTKTDSKIENTLTSKSWTWTKTQYNDGKTVEPKEKNAFMITFNSDNTFNFKTDCNGGFGSCALNDSKIEFSNMGSTKMYCEGAQEDDFVAMLSEVDSFMITDKNELVLEIKYDSGSMMFK